MLSNLDPWNVIGWLVLSGLVLVLLALLVFSALCFYARLKNWLEWRKTRHALFPDYDGKPQVWGWKHGPQRGSKVEIRRNPNGTLRFDFSTQTWWGGQSDDDWLKLRDRMRYTLLSDH